MAAARKISLAEREFLYKDKELPATGFCPKATKKFMFQAAPWIDIKLEVQRMLRSPWENPSVINKNWSLPPLFSPRPNKHQESKMWQQHYSVCNENKFLPKIAMNRAHCESHYSIPDPSRIADTTYSKILSSKPLVLDEKLKVQVISRALKGLEECNKQKLPSDGQIPKGIKRFQRTRQSFDETENASEAYYSNGLSQYMRAPRRLTLRDNSPVYWHVLAKYHKVLEKYQKAISLSQHIPKLGSSVVIKT
uniref:Uncharacterized protein LOC117363668 n=1 Tax=Geotrypetes seraphini TaxID=260995 RepID=A0A6P8RQA6_GEOSA|nr:uncharacterized protein LOC117363668 [Geotrypetes seraphini]